MRILRAVDSCLHTCVCAWNMIGWKAISKAHVRRKEKISNLYTYVGPQAIGMKKEATHAWAVLAYLTQAQQTLLTWERRKSNLFWAICAYKYTCRQQGKPPNFWESKAIYTQAKIHKALSFYFQWTRNCSFVLELFFSKALLNFIWYLVQVRIYFLLGCKACR